MATIKTGVRGTTELMRRIDRKRSEGYLVAQACRELGVTERSYYRWRQRLNGEIARYANGSSKGAIIPAMPHEISMKISGDPAADRIIDAAIESFSALGYKGTTNRGIAAAAKVSHGLVRYYFRSKQRLWIMALERGLREYFRHINESVANLPEQSDDAASRLRVVIGELIRFVAEHPEVPRMLTMEPPGGSSHLKSIVNSYLKSHFTMICELIIEGQRQGTVRRGDPSQMYYLLANASQVFTTPFEFKSLTGRNVFDSQEVESRINMLVGFFIV